MEFLQLWQDKSLGSFQGSPEIVAECRKFAEQKSEEYFLFLHGAVGSGKTHLAVGTMKEMEERTKAVNLFPKLPPVYAKYQEVKIYKNCEFIPVPDLMLMIRKSFSPPEAGEFEDYGFGEKKPQLTEGQIIDRYANSSILILDDLGAEKMSDWAGTMLYLIVNRRYEGMRPTIFTSNLDLKQLAEKLGMRISSRVGSGAVIYTGKTDFRKKD